MTILIAGVLAAVLATAACETADSRQPAQPPTPTEASNSPPANPAPPSDAMTPTTEPPTAAAGASQAPVLAAAGDWIQYSVGNASFKGRTTVRVAGDGTALVTFQRGKSEDKYPGKLDAADLGKLRETLGKNDPRALKSERDKGKPDETRITIAVHAGGSDTTVELWDSEQWKIPALRAIVTEMNAVASKVSGGKVKY
jgi:hypothetical protein